MKGKLSYDPALPINIPLKSNQKGELSSILSDRPPCPGTALSTGTSDLKALSAVGEEHHFPDMLLPYLGQ